MKWNANKLNTNKNDTLSQRFFRYIEIFDTKECIEWVRPLNHGYGVFFHNGKMNLAHRVSYTIFKGKIPDGLWILHNCDNRSCVNPKHLYAGTFFENTFDAMLARALKNYPKTQN